MRILIMGGTRFVGRHLTQAALDAGHEVTLFHRGQTGDGLFPQAEHLLGDRNTDLSRLAGRSWDATIDVNAYLPRQVRALSAALGGRGGHHVYVSTVSVYADSAGTKVGFTEDAALIEVVDAEKSTLSDDNYGELKVACENAARDSYGVQLTIVRPTYVVGPGDHTGRFTWWVRRIARGGEVLAPGNADAPLQVIDARDLAEFMLAAAIGPIPGTYHTVHCPPPYSFGDLLTEMIAQVGPPGTRITWAGSEFLRTAGVTDDMLPLWSGSDEGSVLDAADPTAAVEAGLVARPIARTIRETFEADRAHPVSFPDGVGLTPEREAELLADWAQRD
jgi:2'-hydroxyisoflavone reductase